MSLICKYESNLCVKSLEMTLYWPCCCLVHACVNTRSCSVHSSSLTCTFTSPRFTHVYCANCSEAPASLAGVSNTNLLKSLGVRMRGRVLQTWVRGHCVFNLADPELMTESAVSIVAPLPHAHQHAETLGPDNFVGRMLRNT